MDDTQTKSCLPCSLCNVPFLKIRTPKANHGVASEDDCADDSAAAATVESVVSAEEYKSGRNVKIEKCERNRFTPNAKLTKVELRNAVRWGVPDNSKRSVYMKAWDTAEFLEINRTFYSQIIDITFGAELPTAFGVDIPTFSGGILGYEEDLQGHPVTSDRLEADFSEQNMASDGMANIVSWRKLNPSHFEPHSPQVMQNPTLPRKPSNFSLHSIASASITRRMSSRRVRGDVVSTSSSFYKPPIEVARRSSEALYGLPVDDTDSCITDGTDERIARHGAANTLKATVPFFHMLTENGQFVVTKLLWCISTNFEGVEFCPILASLVSLLLFFLEEAEAYTLVHRLLSEAIKTKKADDDRRLLILSRADAIRVVKATLQILDRFATRVCQHLRTLNVDVAAWIAKYLLSGLAPYLPFDYILRIYGALLFEGVKVLQRYVYALVKVQEPALLKASTKEEAEHILSGYGIVGDSYRLDDFTRLAYSHGFSSKTFGVKQFSSKHLPTAYLTTVKAVQFCRPRLMQRSKIVNDCNWEKMWSCIPIESRLLTPRLMYSSGTDGMSIAAVNKALWKYVDDQMVVFIKTTFGEVLSAYTPFAFRTDARALQGTRNLSGSFICRLQPDTVFYWWTGVNKQLMDCSFTKLSIGADEAALVIDDSVRRGESNYCSSFGSPPLSNNPAGNNSFDIESMEIWLLQSEI